ncbi:MAG: hypothetical protein QHH00_06830 [Methanomassiliicoccales archaeon]|jgi:hypothetical protein|nr:hypothetical protein [Methanomassiliicoccales archaeon]
MIVLMRLFPREKDDAEKIWKFIEEKMAYLPRKKVKPLFMSMQTRARFVTLFVQADEPENIGDLLVEDIGSCDRIVDTKTFPLLKLAFLPTPKTKVKRAKRYSIMLRTKPKDYYAVYKRVLETQPAPNAFIAFGAFLLGDFDVLASVVSESQKSVKEFVTRHFAGIEGVEEVKIFPIKRSRLLMPSEEWQMFQRALLYAPSWMTDEVKDTYAFGSYLTDEDIHLSGAMRSES